MSKEELAKNLGSLWNEYLESIPKAEPGTIIMDKYGMTANIISVQGFFKYLGRVAKDSPHE